MSIVATSSSIMGFPIVEVVPGLAAAARRRFLDEAYAFRLACDQDLGCSRFAYWAWEAASATDSGLFRGECRAVRDGDRWRPAEAYETGRLVWTVPVLAYVDAEDQQALEAIDILAVDPDTGAFKQFNGMAEFLMSKPRQLVHRTFQSLGRPIP